MRFKWMTKTELEEIYPSSFAPAPDDDPRSAGLCITHGDYNGRLLTCPYCEAKEDVQYETH